ncbi:MAG TPA: transposase [Ruminiclostridium sp.]
MTEEEIASLNHPTSYKKRETVVDGYLNIIYRMLCDKVEPAVILAYTVRSGYGGSLNTMQKYIELLAKNNFKLKLPMNWAYKFEYPKDIIIIKRNEILKYITIKNPKVNRDENIGKYMDIIKERYEIVAVLEKAYDEFHKMLMGKEPDDLEDFIRRYETSAIKGFIEGIKKDIAPVKNAISHDVSSGFVEGNNNKFKLIKRILYGRADLVNLFKKSYIAFQSKLDNFNLLQLTQTDAVK